jgi:hypothetical protein
MSILPNTGSILPFNANGRQPFANQSGNAQDRPKAQLWLNVGYDIATVDPETGKPNTTFIQLPNGGIPLDTMQEAVMRGQNDDFLKKLTAQNDLLKTLIAEGGKLAPGGEVTLNLTIKMRRVNGERVIDTKANEYAVPDLASRLIAKPVETTQPEA